MQDNPIGVVLAAGRGTRLGEDTAITPKPLIPIDERVCIDFSLEALFEVVRDVIVVTGHMAEQVEAHLAATWGTSRVHTVRNPDLEAGNLTSLRAARPMLGAAPFILTNADHLFPSDMYRRHFPASAGIQIACERDRPILSDEMKVVADDTGLAAIAKTLGQFDGAYIGTTRIDSQSTAAYWQAFAAVEAEADLASASVEMVLGKLAAERIARPRIDWIKGLVWYEVDTPEDLAQARTGLAA
jgi:choline kinase